MEPNLEELKNAILEGREPKKDSVKVKLFKVVGYKTYDAMKNTFKQVDGQQEIEKQINEFLSTVDGWYLESVNIQVIKNFYPHTVNGEYEEIWYGTVVYREEE